LPQEEALNPFQEIKKVPAIKAIGSRVDISLWDVDTALSRLYEKAVEARLQFREPAIGVRREGLSMPAPFHSDYEVLFPLEGEATGTVAGTEIVELPEQEVASFIHRGPYPKILRTYEKVLDWFRENRYVVAGEPREVFFVAPEPHSGGTQDDMLTEIQVPIRKAA